MMMTTAALVVLFVVMMTTATLVVLLVVMVMTAATLVMLLVVMVMTASALVVLLVVMVMTASAFMMLLVVMMMTTAALVVIFVVMVMAASALMMLLVVMMMTTATALTMVMVVMGGLPAAAGSGGGIPGVDLRAAFHGPGDPGQLRDQGIRVGGGEPQLLGGEGDNCLLHGRMGIEFGFDLGGAVGAVQIVDDVYLSGHENPS